MIKIAKPSQYRFNGATEIYEGACLEDLGFVSERVMSDVWDYIHEVVVWDEGTQRTCTVWLDTDDKVTIDATEEVLAKVEAFKARIKAEHEAKVEADRIAREDAEKRRVAKGKRVRVVKGRKFAKGTEGIVFWMGENQWGITAGVRTSDHKGEDNRYIDVIFISVNNLEVILEEKKEV